MKKIGVMKPDQIVQENLLKKDVVATVNYAWVINFSITTDFRILAHDKLVSMTYIFIVLDSELPLIITSAL